MPELNNILLVLGESESASRHEANLFRKGSWELEKQSKQEMLTSAFVSIVQNMNIPDEKVTKMLGVDGDFMEQLRNNKTTVELKEQAGKGVAKFILAMDNLYHLVGQKQGEAVRWLNEENRAFENRCPIDVMTDDGGLEKVVTYLKESNNAH